MTEISIVRHLKTDDNLANNFGSGDKDSQVLENQSISPEITIELKNNLNKGYLIIHTGLSRTERTANEIATKLGYSGYLLSIPELKERFGGKYAGMEFLKIQEDFPGLISPNELWKFQSQEGGLESIEDFLRRLENGTEIVTQIARGRDVVLVAHAGTIKGLQALKEKPENRLEILTKPTPANGNIFRVSI